MGEQLIDGRKSKFFTKSSLRAGEEWEGRKSARQKKGSKNKGGVVERVVKAIRDVGEFLSSAFPTAEIGSSSRVEEEGNETGGEKDSTKES